MKEKRLLFSVTMADCDMSTFTVGGGGGQRRDKKETGVRITHVFSGAVGEARDTRHQAQNKKLAFVRMANSKRFKEWHRIECARLLGQLESIEDAVNEAMKDSNIKIEYVKSK